MTERILPTGIDTPELVVADDINDKIRYSERGEEEIAQTLTSRCSTRG